MSKMPDNFHPTTRRYNPEGSHLHIRRCENLIFREEIFKNVNSCLKPKGGLAVTNVTV
jgi:hypothetical protein